jgi:thiamine biosynthesis lipoprotein
MSLPAGLVTTPVSDAEPVTSRRFDSMASHVNVQLPAATVGSDGLFDLVESVFAAVEQDCTRFDPNSSLMLANAAPDSWTAVTSRCFQAIRNAYDAYLATDGLFDPRILRSLESIGYDRSFAFDQAPEFTESPGADTGCTASYDRVWAPAFDEQRHCVRIGRHPIDLGGIGKGLALRWAADHLRRQCRWFLIEAGGDCVLDGLGPTNTGWSVGVEHPGGGEGPVAVLRLADLACATTSIRVRHWRSGSTEVHHIIDPRTGRPSAGGLHSVTVVDADPATAEVVSKSLFVLGLAGIGEAAARAGCAALWVGADSTLSMSAAMGEYLLWPAE